MHHRSHFKIYFSLQIFLLFDTETSQRLSVLDGHLLDVCSQQQHISSRFSPLLHSHQANRVSDPREQDLPLFLSFLKSNVQSCRSFVITASRRDMYLLFQGADSELWYSRKQKPAAVRYLMGVSDIQEKQREFYFVTVNSNTPSDQAECSTSCYRVTTFYIHALET